MPPVTRFTEPASVETWDACFRWRAADALCDVTIEDTWWRVAQAVAGPEGGQASPWVQRYVEAFSSWRLLPDERLLRRAGTGTVPEENHAPCAVINVAAFVRASIGGAPRLERDALAATAALAVRFLDDAILNTGLVPGDSGLRIGLMGVGDALRKLGVAYASAQAQDQARLMASALAEGCLRGAVELAEERGAHASGAPTQGLVSRWQELGLPVDLLGAAGKHGVEHVRLTAIQRHPLLARLANGASDALDALPVSMTVAREDATELMSAQLAICEAFQPWTDEAADGAAGSLAALVRACQAASDPAVH